MPSQSISTEKRSAFLRFATSWDRYLIAEKTIKDLSHWFSYLSRYNMATMVTNNSKLLSTKDNSQKKTELVERLMEMDQEKLEALLKLMG